MPVDPAAFIGGLIQQDIGVTQGRAMLRAEGMQMSNAAFSSLYGQVRETLGAREGLQGLDYAALPTGEQYSTWAAGRADHYATGVTTFVRGVGERDASPRFFFHFTAEPHTPDEAVEAAQSQLADAAATMGGESDITILGSVVTSLNRTITRDAIGA